MSKKNFVTCYDKGKDLEKIAEVLMTLVSGDDRLRNINRNLEEFKKDREVTSDEYVLALGEKSSASYRENFPDKYNQYGIHIGFRGAKAWIGVENFDWDKGSLSKFYQELLSLSEELNLDLEDKPFKEYLKIIKENQKKIGKSDKDATANLQNTIASSIVVSKVRLNPDFSLLNLRIFPYLLAYNWFRDLFKKSEQRKLQYKLAVIIFFHKYIYEFLKIDDQEKTEQDF